MKKAIITKDCFCEHYLHEKFKYPRPGLIEKKLKEGDEVEFIREWFNLYGVYYEVKKDGLKYDIDISNIKLL